MSVVSGVEKLQVAPDLNKTAAQDSLSAAEAALKVDPDNSDAATAKVRALITLERFSTAAAFGSKKDVDENALAYALYRANCFDSLRKVKSTSTGVLLAQAQAEFKQGYLQAAAHLLERASQNAKEDDQIDISTNLQAIRALQGDVTAAHGLQASTAFDQHFNEACALATAGRGLEALEALAAAKLEANDDEDRQASIVQAAFVHHSLLGNIPEALELLESLDSHDIVSQNNIIALRCLETPEEIHKALTVYDKIDSTDLGSLNADQMVVLEANKLALRYRAKLNIRKAAKNHLRRAPYSLGPAVLARLPGLPTALADTQKLVDSGDLEAAARFIRSHVESDRVPPGIAAAVKAASQILGKPNETKAEPCPGLRGLGAALEFPDVSYFDVLGNPVLRAAGKLILDPDHSDSSLLPRVEELINGIDMGVLESGLPPLSYSRRVIAVSKSKRKRSGKPKLPKDYDSGRQPSPERWLAKMDRSDYKPPKKARKTQASQGAAVDTPMPDAEPTSAPRPKSKPKTKKKKGKK